MQNYPNPFNGVTLITYVLLKTSDVTLKVYDLLGREVATLVNDRLTAGKHQVGFDARGLASGTYICRITVGSSVTQRSMVLLR